MLIDEEAIETIISIFQAAAAGHGVRQAFLVNDDMPTELGNPPLRWNELFPGDVASLPAGQVDDKGIFALPENLPFSLQDYVDGVVPQSQHDNIPDVMPLRNQDLVKLLGRACLAVVYDSNIDMNYLPIRANLQGARYRLSYFTVLDIVLPGAIPESLSDTSLYDLLVQVEPVDEDFYIGDLDVTARDHEPDSIQITKADYNSATDTVTVLGLSNFAPTAHMTVSIEDFTFEGSMSFDANSGRYEFAAHTSQNLTGRRITISTDEGGAFNDHVTTRTREPYGDEP